MEVSCHTGGPVRHCTRRDTRDTRRDARRRNRYAAAGLALAFWVVACLSPAAPRTIPWRGGKYLARAGLCIACHTDYENKGAELAAATPSRSPSAPSTALTSRRTRRPASAGGATKSSSGHAPRHRPSWPTPLSGLPYTSFTRMTDQDILALKAYLSTVKPVRKENRAPELTTPVGCASAGGVEMALLRRRRVDPRSRQAGAVEPRRLSCPGGDALCRVP